MPLSPLPLHVEQAQAELTRLLKRCQDLSPQKQQQIASEIDRFTQQINQLLASNGRPPTPQAQNVSNTSARAMDELFIANAYHVGMILKGAHAGLFIVDLINHVSTWSPELRDLFGVGPDATSSQEAFIAMIHPDDRQTAVALIEAAIEAGGSFYQEFRLNRPDGEVIWLSSVGFVEHGAQGRPVSIAGINQDITERKYAEKMLRQREAQLRESETIARQQLAEIEVIYQNAPMGLCVFDRQLRWQRINQRMAEMNGLPIEAHLGKTPRELIPDVGEQAEAALNTLLQTGEPLLDIELSGTTPAQPGVQRFWNERWLPIKDDQGAIIGISVAAEEITESKRAEEALRESEAMFSRAFRTSPVAMAITSAGDGRYIDANDRHLELLGYTREELIGRTPFEIGLYADLEKGARVLDLLNQQEIVRNHEMQVRTRAGELRTQLLSLVPFERGGEPCALWTLVDVTDRRRAEEDLRKNTEALRESEEKFRGAFNHAAIGFAMTTPEGRFVDANPAYCKLTGYSLEELKAFAFDRLVHPDDIAENLELNRQMSAGQISHFVIENRYTHKNGQVAWVRKSVSQVIQADGDPKWNVALVEDITERKQAEAELQAASEALNERNKALEAVHNDLVNERNRLLAVMEALPVGLAIYDENGGVIQSNQGFEGVWGNPRPPIESIDDYDLYKAWWAETGERVQPEEWASARAVEHGETVTGQFIKIHKFDDTDVYVLNSGAPVLDAQGHITGGVVTIMDITDRILAEQALKQSQDRFRVALASVPLLVYTCDCDLRYTWVYNSPLDAQVDNILGKRDDEIFAPGAADELIAAKQLALDTGQGGVKEVKVIVRGEVRHYILTTEPIKDSRGKVTGLTCSAIDVTAQKRLELEQEENQIRLEVQGRLMEYREKERAEIARDLHDGPVQLLSATLFNLYTAKEITQDAALRLELEQTAYNLKSAVGELRDTMNALRPPAVIRFGFAKTAKMHVEDFNDRHPELTISLKLFDDSSLFTEIVRLALYRILQESLSNIAKHADASRVWVQTTCKKGSFYLTIRDNGRGFVVPTDLMGQTQKGHFGLAGMKERADAIGAALTVTSELGKGAKVQVVVPAHLVEKH